MIDEDEALERRALKFILNKFYNSTIKVIGEASNGQDAVNKALEYKPDIILMDINMPIINGLKAGEIIKHTLKDTEIIILTAFNYFEYAKSAISIEVSDYLLKPISNKDFCSSIDKIINKINMKKLKNDKNNNINKKYRKSISFVEKEMITSVVSGKEILEYEFNDYRQILDISNTNNCCIVFEFYTEKVVDENTVKKIKLKFSSIFFHVIGGTYLNEIILFIFDDDLEKKLSSDILKKFICNIEEYFKEDIKPHIGIGFSSKNFNELYLSYKKAKLSMEENSLCGLSNNINLVEKVKKYIDENYMRNITLEKAAEYVFISSYYLSRIFRKIEGMNFKDYLIKVRMEKAKKMLVSHRKSIKQISMEVGYSDQNYFSRAFKKYANRSPKEYGRL